ncbi:protein mono-ADP-ribosyltransferase PARP4 isoform X1 [Pogona vitticeps]
MTVAIFANCVFYLKVKKLQSLEKKKLKSCIKENGGQITFVLNQECTHVVTDDADGLFSTHLKAVQKYQLPIIGADFIWNSVREGKLLQTKRYEQTKSLTCLTGAEESFVCGYDHDVQEEQDATKKKESSDKREFNENSSMGGLRWFTDNSEHIPYFPDNFEVAKYDILEKIMVQVEYVVVELQCFQQQCDYPFRICAHYSVISGRQDQKRFIPAKTSEEARRSYMLCIEELEEEDFQLRKDFPPEAEYFASAKLQEILTAEAINSQTLSEEVAKFVELIWAEALGLLNDLLAKPVMSISLNDVSRAEGVLFRLKKGLDNMEKAKDIPVIMSEFYEIIPHKRGLDYKVTKKLLSNKQDLCQLIRDMLNVSETSMSAPKPSSSSKYRALRCRIDALDSNSEEFCKVKQLIKQNTSECPVQVLQIYKAGRKTEAVGFDSHLGNIQSLIHASAPCNFVGILSRGLLLPKIAAEVHGLERTDQGNLGSGIYFSNSISTSLKYSQPSQRDGTRLLVICDVALGTCWDTYETDYSLTAPPPGYDSVHGVCKKDGRYSAFEGDEFVVYKTSQVKIKYVVRFCLANDERKEFNPIIWTESEDSVPSLNHELHPEDYKMPSQDLLNNITAGLLDESGNPIPLKDIHIKGRIIDFVAEVVVFQTYENQINNPIEAKYVFPLDDSAAVCGFEVFIKGKHIIGEVKEKEEAHRQYRKAIIQGDGAYLMDQDAPDIFTVSVGNLPPLTKVLIKIIYVTELSFENGCLSFHLPAAVAPWQQNKALNENTQDSVWKVPVKQVGLKPGAFSLEMSIEMPFKINCIRSWTHQLQTKKTDCKAVVRTIGGSSLDISGFALEILIGDVHLPRMWVEKHPDKNTEACMLVFQPEFEASVGSCTIYGEIIICLDCSNSMAGSEIQQAKQIALGALDSCRFATKLSVIKFGTNFVEFPFCSEDSTVDYAALQEFIKSATATMGNSDLWKTLQYLSLLYPSEGKRNILLISDGHIQNEGTTLQIVKENAKHTRIFTCGVGSTVNRHMLRTLSQCGAGAFEYFDAKSKYNWERKVKCQADRMSSPGCSAVSIKWQKFDTDRPTLMYAPAHIQSLFHHEHLLVYGFISHCTQATLNALVDKQELQAVVSTTELQKTKGTILHKLAARAFIRDYEQGLLHENEMEHEMKKQELKSLIIDLSLKNSIVTQFTSFVAIEKRDTKDDQTADTLNVLELVANEDVDILPYIQYTQPTPSENVPKDSFVSTKFEHASIGFDAVAHYTDESFPPLPPPAGSPFAAENKFVAPVFGQTFSSSTTGLFGLQSSSDVQIPEESSASIKFKPAPFGFGTAAPVISQSAPPPPPPAGSLFARKSKFVAPLFGQTFSSSTPGLFGLQSSSAVQIPEDSSASIKFKPASFGFGAAAPVVSQSAPPPPPPAGSPLAAKSKFVAPVFDQTFSSSTTGLFGLQSSSDVQLPWDAVSDDESEVGSSGSYWPGGKISAQGAELFRSPSLFPHCTTVLHQKHLKPSAGLFDAKQSDLQTMLQTFTLGSPRTPEMALEGWQSHTDPLPSTVLAPDEEQVIPEHPPAAVEEEGSSVQLTEKFLACHLKQKTVEDEEIANEISEGICGSFKKQLKKKKLLSLSTVTVSAQKPPQTIPWRQLFNLQNQDGFWELTPELGSLLDFDIDHLVNVTLAKKGIQSLGPKGKEKLLRLIATLLVLQVVRFKKLEGLVFKYLTKLNDSPLSWVYYPVNKAAEWARKTDREFPAICQRLELGKDWDSATKKLLGIE